jgi:hypothetical protein
MGEIGVKQSVGGETKARKEMEIRTYEKIEGLAAGAGIMSRE